MKPSVAPLLAYVGIGTNLGSRHDNIYDAVSALKEILDDLILTPLVETEALDREGQIDSNSPSYLNSVAIGRFNGTPRELLTALQKIERQMGRNPAEKGAWLPRTIDLDIVVLTQDGEQLQINETDLIVPHPRNKERPWIIDVLQANGM